MAQELTMQLIFILVLLYVSVFDFIYKKIPNFIVIVITVLGFINNFILLGCVGLTNSINGLVIGLIVALFFYRLNSLGAGDVKLIAAVGCFVGTSFILNVFAYSYVVSAILGLAYIKLWLPWRSKHRNAILNGRSSEKSRSQRIPMAPGISIATLYVLLYQT